MNSAPLLIRNTRCIIWQPLFAAHRPKAAWVKQRHPCSLLKQLVLIPTSIASSAQRHLNAFFRIAVITMCCCSIETHMTAAVHACANTALPSELFMGKCRIQKWYHLAQVGYVSGVLSLFCCLCCHLFSSDRFGRVHYIERNFLLWWSQNYCQYHQENESFSEEIVLRMSRMFENASLRQVDRAS